MAEPFGIVAGTIGIVAAFSTCVEIFNYVQLGHRFGRDYWTNRLKLTVLQLRLSRWGEAVGVYRDPRLGNPAASEAEIQLAKDVLLQILLLFEESNRISQKFGSAGASDDRPSAPENPADAAALAVDNRMRNTSARRQKAASILQVSSWTIHYRASLKELIDDIASLVDNLERLFPVPSTRRTELIQQEVAEVETTESPALATAAKGVDDALHEAAVQLSCKGHRYKDVVIEAGEDGCVLDGDAYSDNYTHGSGPTTSHLYDSVKITGTNRLRVLNGNRYGGGDFFSRK